MVLENDPSGTDEHTRGRRLRAVSDQNLITEVQNWGSFMQWPSSWGDDPSLWDRKSRYFSKSILSQVPA
jgi:hypothetical protein